MRAVQKSLLPGAVPDSTERIALRRYPRRPRTVAIKALFLGGGLQSSLMAEMALAGELEQPDLVLFNDTHDEPWWVYQQVGVLRNRLQQAGIEYVQPAATCTGIMHDLTSTQTHGSMPVFVRNPDGSVGRLRRQCTDYFKVQPGNVAVRWYLLRKGLVRPKAGTFVDHDHQGNPKLCYLPSRSQVWEGDYCFELPAIPASMAVECWFGYTTDEKLRAERKGGPKWQAARYPLIEKGMSRADCERWYAERGRRIPFKSACIQCPYRSDEAWLWMKQEQPDAFEEACRHDDTLRMPEIKRKGGAYSKIRGEMYLHQSCVPLRDIDFEALVAARKRQSSMFEIELIDSCSTDGGFSCMS